MFVRFNISGLKEKKQKFKLIPKSEKKSRALFVSVNSPWMKKVFFVPSSSAVNGGYDHIKVNVVCLQCS